MTFYFFKVNGTLAFFYLLRKKFDMNLKDGSKLQIAVTLNSVFGSSIGLYLLKKVFELEA